MENKNMWLAICELGDYFSRFAGGNRPRNMSESEIFLYVLCKTYQKIDPNFDILVYVDNEFLEAARPIINKVDYFIEQIDSQNDLKKELIDAYYYYDSKLGFDKTSRWIEFKNILES